MHSLLRKLRSRSGAAMVMALLFLLFCTTIGIITLSSASANAGKLSRMRGEQQSYLAVRSAAQAFEDIIGKLEFSGSYHIYHVKWKETVTGDSGGTTEVPYEYKDYFDKTGAFSHAGLETLTGSKVKALFFSVQGDRTAGITPTGTFDYELELQTEVPDYPVVQAKFQLSADETDRYSIKLFLFDQANEGNPMTITFLAKPPVLTSAVGTLPPGISYVPSGVTPEIEEWIECTYVITWEPGVLERGDGK